MIPDNIVIGTKVVNETFGVGIFKGFYCDFPLYAFVEYENGLWKSFKKDEIEIKYGTKKMINCDSYNSNL